MIAGSGMWALGAASKKRPWAIRIQSPNSDAAEDAAEESGAGSVVLEAGEVGAGEAEQGEHDVDGLGDAEHEAGEDAEQRRYGDGEDDLDGGRTVVQQRGHVAHGDP